MRALMLAATFLALVPLLAAREDADPLPAWNDGPAKMAIVKFVKEATDKKSKGHVPPEERIATFDNDGTLWCEQPVIQGVFMMERLKKLAKDDPKLVERPAVKAALAGDKKFLHEAGEKAIFELLALTHGNMKQEDFDDEVKQFFAKAKHPKFDQPFTKMYFQPMRELLDYLRANGFKTYICSGGGEDFMRHVSQECYGIPPEQVIGSSVKKVWRAEEDRPYFYRTDQLGFFNDKAAKPVNIDLQVGRTPAFAAGNVRSGGDVEMLRYCQSRKGPSLQLMVNHDDAKREFAYAEKDNASLNAAKKKGWVVVSVKDDWKRVFPFEK